MRTKHTAHNFEGFPVNSAAFLSEHELVLGGGGGASKSGVKNRLRLFKVDNDMKLELVNDLELSRSEDAPMSLAADSEGKGLVAGINGSNQAIESSNNENCRLFHLKENQLSVGIKKTTLTNGDLEDYQKVTAFSPNGDLVAVAGKSDLAILAYPSLQPVAGPIHVTQGEIYDATFSQSTLVVTTTENLLVYSLKTTASEKGKEKAVAPLSASIELVKTVDRPTLPGTFASSSFRAAKFNPTSDKNLYAIINTAPLRSRAKHAPYVSFVVKWDTESWEVVKIRKIADKRTTSFAASPDGKLLAFGAADLRVGVLDSRTLSPLLTILKAHEGFPTACLQFNTTSTLLVSGSADNSIRLVTIPSDLAGASWQTFIGWLVAILVVLLAFAAQAMYSSR